MSTHGNPPCFGMIVAYYDQSSKCQHCAAKERCALEVLNRAERLSDEVDTSEIIRMIGKTSESGKIKSRALLSIVDKTTGELQRHVKLKRCELTAKERELISLVKGRYAKAGRLVKSIFKSGIDLQYALAHKINPYRQAKSHSYMETVCDLLLEDGFTRSRLRKTFAEKFNWTYSTANSHVLVVTHTLSALGIIKEECGQFTLRGIK